MWRDRPMNEDVYTQNHKKRKYIYIYIRLFSKQSFLETNYIMTLKCTCMSLSTDLWTSIFFFGSFQVSHLYSRRRYTFFVMRFESLHNDMIHRAFNSEETSIGEWNLKRFFSGYIRKTFSLICWYQKRFSTWMWNLFKFLIWNRISF